ncbi:hypothetical protein [Magnetospirillum fulvum]|uniref:Flp pilus assembly protein TadG n=1 Tax=Magnetospirillum fulvum MGU-K5 TaxID=1316936 RepID=S9S5H8_MAGFU|nr:hypothetical protein [Magnetospirillum fulvum]EPY01122.1 hypothetical protein K678_12479 [Magnetospirillum fulvum MGU-K5]
MRKLIADCRAVTAIELALLIPILMIILVGFYESYIFVRSIATMERTAFTLSDLVSRRNLVCDASSASDPNSLNTYLSTVAPMIAQPLDIKANGEIIVSAVVYAKTVGAAVNWQKISSYTLNGAASQVGVIGGAANLPTGIIPKNDGDTVIVTEIFYNFDWFPYLRIYVPSMPGRMTMSRSAYFRARVNSLSILYDATTNANCPS